MEKLIIKGHPNYVPHDVFWGTWNEVIDKAQTVMDGVPYTLDHRNDGI